MYDLEAVEKVSLDIYNKAVDDADKAYAEAINVASAAYDNAFSTDLVTAKKEKEEREKLERTRNAAWHNYNNARDYSSETWEIHQTALEVYSTARDSYDNANDAYKAACGAQGIPWDEYKYDKGEA